MTLLLIISILIRVVATAWSVVLLRRLRDWRMGFLTLMLAFMTYRQCATLQAQPRWWPPTSDGIAAEWSALVVSVFACLAVVFLARFLTERQQVEAALRTSESRHRRLVESNIIGVMIANMDGHITEANDRFLKLVGYTREELNAGCLRWDALTPPEWKEADLRAIGDLKSTGACTPYEKEYFHKDGSRVPILLAVAMLEGTPGDGICIIEDLSARKRAEEALDRSYARLKKVLDVKTVGVMFWDITNGCMTDANDTFLKLMGYSRREMESGELTWQKLTPPEYVEMSLAEMEKLQVTGYIGPYEKEYLRKDGTRQWFVFAGSSLGDNTCVEFCVDISERKQAEAERQKFVSLADSSHEFIGMCDREFKPFYVNAAGLSMVGLPDLESACQVKVQDCFFPEDQPFITEEFFPRVLREGHGDVEIRFRHFQTGTPIWMLYNVFNIRDASGEIVGWATVSRDITERKAAEAALRESEARLTGDLEAMKRLQAVGALLLGVGNLQTTLDAIVEAAMAITGADMANLQLLDPASGDLRIRAHRGFDPSWVDFWDHAYTGKGSCHVALERGERVIVEDVATDPIFAGTPALAVQLKAGVRAVQSTPLVSRSGKALGMFSTHFKTPHRPDERSLRLLDLLARQTADMIERSQSEAALRESEARLRLSVAASNIGLWDWNLATNDVYFSPEWKSQLGYAGDEIPNRFEEWESRLHPDDLAPTEAKVRRFIENPGAHYEVEFRMRHKDGSWRWIFTRATILCDARGKPTRMLGCHIDITERKRAEEALRASEERLRTIFDTEPECVKLLAADGSLLEMNPAGLRMLEADSFQQVGNRCVYPLIVETDRTAFRSLTERVFRGESGSLEFQITGLKGAHRWLKTHATPLRNEQGKVISLLGITRDITERKRAEEALRVSEDRYRDLVEHSHDLICTHDLTGRILSANPNAEKILGYEPGALLRMNLQDILAPEALPRFALYLRRIKQRGAARGQMIVQTRTGERRLWEYDNTLRTAGVPAPLVRGLARDITARKQAEAALREAEARLRLSVAASNIGLWDWDLATNEVYFSREWKSQLGHAEDEISNRLEEWQSRLHPDDLAPTLAKVQRFMEDPHAHYEAEFRLRHKDGSWRWIFTQAQVFRDAAGKPARMMGCHIDITERKQAEHALQASELRHRLMAETIVAYAFAYRVEPDRSLKLDWATSPITKVLGYSEAELKSGVSFRSLIHPDDRATQQAALDRVTKGGEAEILEMRLTAKSGQLRWLRSHLRPEWSDTERRVVRIYGACQDITERKQAEEALRQLSGRLLRLQDEERRRIARELHDNTAQQLAALAMNLSSLQKAVAGKAVAERTLADSLALTDRAALEIRTLSYLLHPPVLEEVGLVGALRDYAGGLAKRSGVKIEVEADGQIGRLDKEHEMALFRLTQEALGNIVRHSGSATATIRLTRRDKEICLEVKDDGHGIPPEKLQRVRSAAAELGVGIAGMRERMRQLGGRLEIDSNSGGTTVRAVLQAVEKS